MSTTMLIALVVACVGAVLACVGWIRVLIEAFGVRLGWGLGALLFPVVGVVFVALHWQRTRRAALLWLPGSLLSIVGIVLGVVDHTQATREEMASKRAAVEALADAARRRAVLEVEAERARARAASGDRAAGTTGSARPNRCNCDPGDPLCPCL